MAREREPDGSVRPGGAGGPPYERAARPVVTGTGAFIPAGAGGKIAPRRERPGAVARAERGSVRPGGAERAPVRAARPVVTGTGAFIPAGAGSRRAPRRERPGAVARAGPTVRCGRAAQAGPRTGPHGRW